MLTKIITLFFVFIFLSFSSIFAAEEPIQGWKYSAIIGINADYINFINWSAGGVNATTYGFLSDFSTNYIKLKNEFNAQLKFEYGATKLAEDIYKKSVDTLILDLKNKYSLTNIIKSYVNVTTRTQVFDSYVYFTEPQTVVTKDQQYSDIFKFKNSQSFDPLNFEEGIGILFDILKKEPATFDIFAGIGARQLITDQYFILKDTDTTEEIEYSKAENYSDYGIEAGFNLKWQFYENMEFSSKLKYFYAANEGNNGKNNDLTTWNNTLSMKVNKFVSVNVTADMLYDTNLLEKAQWKQVLLLNFSFQLI